MGDVAAVGASTALLVGLDDPACRDPALAGSKAATLASLSQAGLPVPPGVVVPAAAFDGADELLPMSVRTALSSVTDLIGRGPWAVRSSSTAEDREQASFAGQFETVLDVDLAHLHDAVLRCWRSRLADRVAAYGGEGASRPMAVLIQPMIAADAAGVAFTVDPVSGRRRTIIEAVAGPGERLVAGSATPERWVVEEDGSLSAPQAPAILDTAKARAIGELARTVEHERGPAQDVEWAMGDGELWLLQARPITALPERREELIPIPVDVPPGDWTRDAFHEPVPLSPFGKVLLTEQILKVLPGVFAEFGILIDRGEVAVIGGWIYNRLVPLGAPPPRQTGRRTRPSPPPRWLLAILMRLHPAIRRRSSTARDAIAADLPVDAIRRWIDEWRPEHQRDIARALSVDLSSLTDQQLAAELDHRLQVIAHPAHARVAIAYFILVYEFSQACRELLGWDTARMLTLLEGLSTTSTEPARQAARLARLSRSRPAVHRLLARPDEVTPERLAEVDPEFARAFADYVATTGHRAVRYDVVDPTLAEMPHLLLRLIADQARGKFEVERAAANAEQRRTEAAAEARRLLASRPGPDRDRFELALARAREAYPAWEDRVWWTQSAQTALLRYLALEIGRRLADRGQLATREDVFFLEVDEARRVLLDGGGAHETVRVRKGQRAWAIAHPGPPAYGDPPSGEPPFDRLPPAARLVNEAVLWGFGQFFGTPADPRSDSAIVGTPASAGRYTGTVRVVRGEDEFARIRPGDVVICPATSPAWSVVFPSIGALVADSGGILSHPAIIAREHGIPAVVGTGNATGVLRDGQRVTVDGDAGLVEVVDRGAAIPVSSWTTVEP